MRSIQENMQEFQEQLGKGAIQKAYRALLDYMNALRRHFEKQYPGYSISGLYQGYMDMTYFAITPPSLKQCRLKIAIVFNYEAFRIEAWLSAANRKVLHEYWELLKDGQWPEYRLVTPAKGVDSIIECDLADNFDFNDLDILTNRIEKRTIEFIEDVEKFLSVHQAKSED